MCISHKTVTLSESDKARIAHARICLDYSDIENTCYCPVKYQTLEERKKILGYEPRKN